VPFDVTLGPSASIFRRLFVILHYEAIKQKKRKV
jgi:hypothetical protein